MRRALLAWLLLLVGHAASAAGVTAYQPSPPCAIAVGVPLGYTLTLAWNPATTYVGGYPMGYAEYQLWDVTKPAAPVFLGYVRGTTTTYVVKTAAVRLALNTVTWDPHMNPSGSTPPICIKAF